MSLKELPLKKRLSNWYNKPDTRNKHVVRVKVSDAIISAIDCLLCLKPTSYMGSVKANVLIKYGHTSLMNPKSIGNPTEYVTTSGNMLHVDTVKSASYPESKTGRVCNSCKHKLTLAEILPEFDDRQVEVYSDQSKLGFGKGDNSY